MQREALQIWILLTPNTRFPMSLTYFFLLMMWVPCAIYCQIAFHEYISLCFHDTTSLFLLFRITCEPLCSKSHFKGGYHIYSIDLLSYDCFWNMSISSYLIFCLAWGQPTGIFVYEYLCLFSMVFLQHNLKQSQVD